MVCVGIGVHIGHDVAIGVVDVKKTKIGGVGKEVPFVHQREDLPPVALDKVLIRCFIPVRLAVLHSVLLSETLNLSMPEHRETGHRHHQCGHTKVLVPRAELRHRCLFIGVVMKLTKRLSTSGS